MKKVMVFGVFDGFHEGHEAFLREARSFGDYLIAVVAQDHVVRHLFGKEPAVNFVARFEELEKRDKVDEVAIGGAAFGNWEIVERLRPDIVAFAADQKLLLENFKEAVTKLSIQPKVKILKSFELTAL